MKMIYVCLAFCIISMTSLNAKKNELNSMSEKSDNNQKSKDVIRFVIKDSNEMSSVKVDPKNSKSYKYENKTRFKFKFKPGSEFNNIVKRNEES